MSGNNGIFNPNISAAVTTISVVLLISKRHIRVISPCTLQERDFMSKYNVDGKIEEKCKQQ